MYYGSQLHFMIEKDRIRHVDVAILYSLGQKDRAHEVALKLKPIEITGESWTKEEVKDFMSEFNQEDSE